MSRMDRNWRVWQMGDLDSDDRGKPSSKNQSFTPQKPAEKRLRTGPTPQPLRKATRTFKGEKQLQRELGISKTLFDLAKEEAIKKGHEQGQKKGYELGYQEGLTKAKAEHESQYQAQLAETLEPVKKMVVAYRQAVDGLNEHISYALVELALEVAQQLAGRALELKPEHILDDIEDLLEQNPSLAGRPTLFVNIDDLPLVEHQLSETLHAANWQLRPDVNLERGDCRIETEEQEIDASRQDRWARLLLAVGHNEH